jgi:hypothetical protein
VDDDLSSSCLWKRTWVKNSRVPVVAEGGEGERVAASGPEQLSTSSASTVTVTDATHGVPGDHPLPALLDRLDAPVGEPEVRLVVHAVQALDDGLLELLDHLGALAVSGRSVDALVVDLDLELLRPAAVAAQPGSGGLRGHACDSTGVPEVLYEVDGRVATLTLNRPSRPERDHDDARHDLRAALARAWGDDGVHAIRLRGAGRAVLRRLRHRLGSRVDGRPRRPTAVGSDRRLPMMSGSSTPTCSSWRSPKPVIAQVHGFCVGGGTDFALCSDLIVCAEDCRIGYPPARVWGSPTTMMWTYRLGPRALEAAAADRRRARRPAGGGVGASPARRSRRPTSTRRPRAGRARGAAAAQPAAHDEAAGQPGHRADGPLDHPARRDAARRRRPHTPEGETFSRRRWTTSAARCASATRRSATTARAASA